MHVLFFRDARFPFKQKYGNPKRYHCAFVRPYTANVTGETLVLNKDLPSIKKGFSQHKAVKVGKIKIFQAQSKDLLNTKVGKSLLSTRVAPDTFTV